MLHNYADSCYDDMLTHVYDDMTCKL